MLIIQSFLDAGVNCTQFLPDNFEAFFTKFVRQKSTENVFT